MCGLDERNHWSCEGEAHWWHLGLGWGLQLAALQARRRGEQSSWEEIRRSLEDGSYLRDGLRLLKQHDPHGAGRALVASASARCIRLDPAFGFGTLVADAHAAARRLVGPALRGLLDLAEQARAVGGQPDLHIGPATHLQWWPQSSRLLLNFFQHHLQDHPSKDASDGVAMTGVHLWDQTKARWRRTHTTNPAHQPIKESPGWSLSSTGLACLDPSEGSLIKDGSDGNGSDGSGSEGSGQVVIVHDPWRPSPLSVAT